jgi:splicing factor 3B subunit 3
MMLHLFLFLLQETSLELVTVGDDGVLQSICEQDMFGIIKDVGLLQWHSRYLCGIPEVQYLSLAIVFAFLAILSCKCTCLWVNE